MPLTCSALLHPVSQFRVFDSPPPDCLVKLACENHDFTCHCRDDCRGRVLRQDVCPTNDLLDIYARGTLSPGDSWRIPVSSNSISSVTLRLVATRASRGLRSTSPDRSLPAFFSVLSRADATVSDVFTNDARLVTCSDAGGRTLGIAGFSSKSYGRPQKNHCSTGGYRGPAI